PLERELATDTGRDAMGELVHFRCRYETNVAALDPTGTLDEYIGRGVDEHVGDGRIVEQRLEDAEAEQRRRERGDLVLRHARTGGVSDAFMQRPPSGGVGVGHEHRARIEA